MFEQEEALGKVIDVLLVEDNPDDVELTMEAFDESKLKVKLHVAIDGVEALNFLQREAGYTDAPEPDLILLDLNLPKKDGREVLKEIKKDDRLRAIPVVILTTSESEADILKSYQLYANCYITKPVDFEQFARVIASVEQFWFTVVRLPKPTT